MFKKNAYYINTLVNTIINTYLTSTPYLYCLIVLLFPIFFIFGWGVADRGSDIVDIYSMVYTLLLHIYRILFGFFVFSCVLIVVKGVLILKFFSRNILCVLHATFFLIPWILAYVERNDISLIKTALSNLSVKEDTIYTLFLPLSLSLLTFILHKIRAKKNGWELFTN